MGSELGFEDIARALTDYKPPLWEEMPDLDLYMDQVITYLKRRLALFQAPEEPSLVTPSIINNYVKGGIAPRPVNKKYARPQLAALTIACILKRVLPMQSVKKIVAIPDADIARARYDRFFGELGEMLAAAASELEAIAPGGSTPEQAEDLALRYAMRACVECLVADRLLCVSKPDPAPKPREKT